MTRHAIADIPIKAEDIIDNNGSNNNDTTKKTTAGGGASTTTTSSGTDDTDTDTNSPPAFVIPKGSTILVNIQAIHHNPKYWPNPMKYDPSRFIISKEDGTNNNNNNHNIIQQPEPYTFLPFIAGPRNCLGQHLSLLESKIVISMLTQHYNFTLPQGEVLETKSWDIYDPRHRFMVPVCPQKELIVMVSKKEKEDGYEMK